jgi:hypothetical protein
MQDTVAAVSDCRRVGIAKFRRSESAATESERWSAFEPVIEGKTRRVPKALRANRNGNIMFRESLGGAIRLRIAFHRGVTMIATKD